MRLRLAAIFIASGDVETAELSSCVAGMIRRRELGLGIIIGPALLVVLIAVGIPIVLIVVIIDGLIFAPRRKRAAEEAAAARSSILSSTSDPEVWIRTYVDEQRFAPSARSDGDKLLVAYASAMTERSFNEVTKQLVPAVLERFRKFQSIEVIKTTDLIDIRGQESHGPWLKASFTRENSATINWPKVQTDNVHLLADEFWTHSSIEKTSI